MTAQRKTSVLATPRQYSEGALESQPKATAAGEVKQCAICKSRFSGDARFCPFDGEPLGIAGVDVPRDPLLGTVIDGRYQVCGVLGEGGMGTVYDVKHVLLERPFAMKVLRADLSTETELAMRFTREARAAAAVSHPNVVHITDFGALPSGQPYFVMERLSGTSLSGLLRSGRLPPERAVSISRQVALALGAAHEVGIVHRDLKPDNVFICDGGSEEIVKVLDFGLAKVAGQSRLTKAGMVFGTPHYMSPEQAAGGAIDHRSDMYSLGVLMYEMLTGRVPFEADTFMGVMTKHMYVEPVPPHELLGSDELGVLEDIILHCLDKKSDRRFTSMAEIVAALEQATHSTPGGARLQRGERRARSRPPSALADLFVASESSAPPKLPVHTLRPWQWGVLSVTLAVLLAVVWWRLSRAYSTDARETRAASTASASTLASDSARQPTTGQPTEAVIPAEPAMPSGQTSKAVAPHLSTSKRGTQTPTAASAPTDAARNRPKYRRSSARGDIVDPWAR